MPYECDCGAFDCTLCPTSTFGQARAIFWGRVEKRDENECWLWKLAVYKKDGYGATTWEGKPFKAHRLAFILSGGLLTKDKPLVLHSCDNPPCCNPAHLRAGNSAENNLDARIRGRARLTCGVKTPQKGENGSNVKLTMEKVLNIREKRLKGDSYAKLARLFKVSKSNIAFIVRGKTWQS